MENGLMGSSFGVLEDLGDETVGEISINWYVFSSCSDSLINGDGENPRVLSEFSSAVKILCKHGWASFIQDFFLRAIEQSFKKNASSRFWSFFDDDCTPSSLEARKRKDAMITDILSASLEEICSFKQSQEKCLSLLENMLLSFQHSICSGNRSPEKYQTRLLPKYQLMVSSVMFSTLPGNFPEFLRAYFKRKLEELSTVMMEDDGDESTAVRYYDYIDKGNKLYEVDKMDVDENHQQTAKSSKNVLVEKVGKVVTDLRSLGFASMTEDAYASAIFLLLKDKVEDLVDDDYKTPVLELIKEWIQVVILPFLSALLSYLGDTSNRDLSNQESPLAFNPIHGENVTPEGLIRWKLRLEYFAYETVQDLRIAKLFDIIVDYPDSSPAIEDLKQCLENTGQHSKLIDSFISALRYRLLTAGASTNDILHQYLSTIKALRRIDPTGVFLEAVGQPIRDYLRGRKDTIKCIVTMLTDGTGGNSGGFDNPGDSLLEELNRNADHLEISVHDDDFNADDKQAWINAQSWEPDPIEADPLKSSRNGRKVDILGMIVSIIGSKDHLVNQYRIMLAEKLLNKSDYDIDSEIRTLELLKIHFGESSMQKCEIMLNDLIHSKRTNTNIKATLAQSSQKGQNEPEISMDLFDATIISSNFWPPFQLESESVHLPEQIDQLLAAYARRFHEIKAPRKLNWKKSIGVVKLELQFEDRIVEFRVSPLCATIILKFQEQSSWTSRKLSASIGVPVDALKRAISFWISKGIIAESVETESDDHVFTIIEDMGDTNKNSINSGKFGGLIAAEEEGESSISSVEDQFKKEMTVYEKFIFGMLTNFGSMALERIHNTLKMFCMADHPYDKSVHQLQNFLSGLVSEEKLELRDGMYFLKKYIYEVDI